MALCSSKLFGNFSSRLFPSYPKRLRLGEDSRDLPNCQDSFYLVENTLLRNLSAHIEPRFRKQLSDTLTLWLTHSLDYSKATKQIKVSLDNRSKVLGKIIPSHAISRLLIAHGFFSLAQHRAITESPQLDKFRLAILRLGWSLKSSRNRSRLQKVELFSILFGRTDRFSSRWLASFLENDRLTYDKSSCLIIGPGPRSSLPDLNKYDFVFVIPNRRDEDLLDLLSKHSNWSVFINNRRAKDLVSNPKHSLHEFISKAPFVFCNMKIGRDLDKSLGMKTLDSNSPFSFWGNQGMPNMAQKATGVALESLSPGGTLDLVGVSFYADAQVYHEADLVADKKTANQDFYLCRSMSLHNPVPNYLIMRALFLTGVINGNASALEILGLGLEKYLERLDQNLGRLRR